MRYPMQGIKVVEVAMYGFVTSGGAVLADWGADVIKIEHPVTGDPQRGLRRTGSFATDGGINPNVEHPNRGKRSIGIDVSTEAEGREMLYELVADADVFLTNFLPGTPRSASRSTSSTSARSTRRSSTCAAARSAPRAGAPRRAATT